MNKKPIYYYYVSVNRVVADLPLREWGGSRKPNSFWIIELRLGVMIVAVHRRGTGPGPQP
jgi:hypothetical protein